jgi:hypothetical protein
MPIGYPGRKPGEPQVFTEKEIKEATVVCPLDPHQMEVLRLLNLRPDTFYAGS